MNILYGLVLSFPLIGPASEIIRLQVQTAPIRDSNLPDRIKGAILVSFLKEGMSYSEAQAILGKPTFRFLIGDICGPETCCCRYGISYSLHDGRVSNIRFEGAARDK